MVRLTNSETESNQQDGLDIKTPNRNLVMVCSHILASPVVSLILQRSILKKKKKIVLRARERLVVPLIYFLVNFCMCPDWGSNLQPWPIRTRL